MTLRQSQLSCRSSFQLFVRVLDSLGMKLVCWFAGLVSQVLNSAGGEHVFTSFLAGMVSFILSSKKQSEW